MWRRARKDHLAQCTCAGPDVEPIFVWRIPIPDGGKVMIFVPTRNTGATLQGYLRDQGLETPFYHAKLGSAWDREQLVKRFKGESDPIVDRIICTSAFGMGLDVPNV